MRPPDHHVGPVEIWRLNPPDPPVEPAHAAGLSTWIIHGPFNPFWSWWMLGVVHLREIEGVPPPSLVYPDAQYELMIYSLNPERGTPDIDAVERGEDWGDPAQPKYLTPPDVEIQFDGITDQQAIQIGEWGVKAILDGRLSPDTDFLWQWVSVIKTTVEHLRAGLHPEPVT